MFFKTKFLIIIIYLNQCVCNDLIETINDFLLIQNRPTQITSFLCWNKTNKIDLNGRLSKSGFLYNNVIWGNKFMHLHKPEQQLFILDMSCSYSNDILNKANEVKLVHFPYRWLLLGDEGNLDNLEIYPNSRIYVLKQINDSFIYKSIYKPGKTHAMITNDVALWQHGFKYYNTIYDMQNRSDLMGLAMNISIVTIFAESMNHLVDARDNEKDAVSKHNYVLVNHLADRLNITRNFLAYRSWGTLIPNTNKYNLLLGDLQSGISEIGGTPSFLTRDRMHIFSYSVAPTYTRVLFVFRAPPLSVVANVFTLPFDIWVWYACFILLGVICLVIYLIIQWEWRDETFRQSIQDKYGILRPTFIDILQMEIGAICQQGSEAEPKSLSGQIATFSVFLALMFLYTSYSANIVALLQSTDDSINSINDLIESKIELGVDNKPYALEFIKALTGREQVALYKKKLSKRNSFLPLEPGVKRMRNEFYGLHAERDAIYKVISKTFLESEKCGLKEIGYWTLTDPYITLRKNSAYKELFNVVYAKLLERGVSQREYRRVYIKRPLCQNQGANFMSVSISDSYFAFLLFTVGVSCAVFIFLMERMIKKYNDKRLSNQIIVLSID